MKEHLKRATPDAYKADGSVYYTCPRCGGKRKLEVTGDQLLWFCHKCQMGGRLDSEPVEVALPDKPKRKYWFRPVKQGDPRWTYLEGRGLSAAQIAMLAPHEGVVPYRVYFPIVEYGYTVYWVGRAYRKGQGPVYWYPPNGAFTRKKSEVLWGQPPRCSHVHLTEGILDAVWLPQGMAMLGNTLSAAQAELLQYRKPSSVTFVLDGDWDRLSPSLKRLQRVYVGPVYRVKLPPDKDPGDLKDSMDAWLQRKEQIA